MLTLLWERNVVAGFSDPKSVMPAQRVKEHPGEALCVSNAKLFCCACREELSLKANILKSHIKSNDASVQQPINTLISVPHYYVPVCGCLFLDNN